MKEGVRGIIAAGHELTAEAGMEMFKNGGNAFDAALAASFASFVCESALTGPGGGGFMTVHTSDGSACVYDFFTNMPGLGAGLEPGKMDFFPVYIDFADTVQEIYIGRASAAVPGTIAGLNTIHENHCTLPLETIMAPAIAYASEGIRLTSWQAYFNRLLSKMLEISEDARRVYAPEGRFLQEGETLFHRDMARTFEYLAAEGLERFYDGNVADRIIEGFGVASGGIITRKDLEQYRALKRDPLKSTYRGRTICTNPPPSSGGSLICFALRLLEGFDVRALGHNRAGYLKLLGLVMGVTNRARAEWFNHRVHDEGIAADFLSEEKVSACRDNISGALDGGDADLLTGNTTHISAVDMEGNVAALTTSTGMGCGFMIPGTGIMMNNMLGEKDLNPGGFHSQSPGVRMSSMMSPTIVMLGGVPEIVLGTGGSKRIRSAILQVIVNIVDHGLSVAEAVNSPRVHLEAGELDVEKGVVETELTALEGQGLKLKRWAKKDMYFGGVHTIICKDGSLRGAGDLRRGGTVKEFSE